LSFLLFIYSAASM